MNKADVKKVIGFLNEKRDFVVSMNCCNNVFTCKIHNGLENFMYQEIVNNPNFPTFSVDFKEIKDIFDKKIKAKNPFTFEFDENKHILSIVEVESKKIVAKVKYFVSV